jgi:anti-anti-sigma factor
MKSSPATGLRPSFELDPGQAQAADGLQRPPPIANAGRVARRPQRGAPQASPVRLHIALSQSGASSRVAWEGELDLAGQPSARSSLEQALAGLPEQLVLDLSGVSFMDCSGLRVVIEGAEHSSLQGTRLTIVPGPPAVQRLFEILDLTAVLPFAARTAAHSDATTHGETS